jgi:Domain of unknown function (DUF4873)
MGETPDATVVPFPAPDVAAEPADDGYDGPAELVHADGPTQVQVTLRGHFDPISGHYRWYGRVMASPEVAALVAAGGRAVRLRTPHAEVETRLTDVDPWGRPRVEGFGTAPFAVLDDLPDDTA